MPSWPRGPGTAANDKTVASAALDNKIFERVKAATAYIEGQRTSGTAFVVGSGLLVTNNHVLQDEYIDSFRVRFISTENPKAEALPVKLVYRDRRRDLALLAVDTDKAPLRLSKKEIRAGDPIAVVGHPSRFEGAFTQLHKVTVGAVEGAVVIERETWYHVRADAAPGNSGGPVINRNTGEVIGILTLILQEERNDRERLINPKGREEARDPKKQAGDSFCIPSTFVHDAVARVEAISDREKLSKQVTARYAAEMVTLQIDSAQLLSGPCCQ